MTALQLQFFLFQHEWTETIVKNISEVQLSCSQLIYFYRFLVYILNLTFFQYIKRKAKLIYGEIGKKKSFGMDWLIP